MINLKSLLLENATKLIMYHGTGDRFRKFNLNYCTHGTVWFTSNKQSIIDGEVGAYGKGYIMTAEITIQNPANWDEYDKKSIAELKRDGYDGVVLDSTENSDIDCIVWNINQIKVLKIDKV